MPTKAKAKPEPAAEMPRKARPVMTAADRRNLANRMAGRPAPKGT